MNGDGTDGDGTDGDGTDGNGTDEDGTDGDGKDGDKWRRIGERLMTSSGHELDLWDLEALAREKRAGEMGTGRHTKKWGGRVPERRGQGSGPDRTPAQRPEKTTIERRRRRRTPVISARPAARDPGLGRPRGSRVRIGAGAGIRVGEESEGRETRSRSRNGSRESGDM